MGDGHAGLVIFGDATFVRGDAFSPPRAMTDGRCELRGRPRKPVRYDTFGNVEGVPAARMRRVRPGGPLSVNGRGPGVTRFASGK